MSERPSICPPNESLDTLSEIRFTKRGSTREKINPRFVPAKIINGRDDALDYLLGRLHFIPSLDQAAD